MGLDNSNAANVPVSAERKEPGFPKIWLGTMALVGTLFVGLIVMVKGPGAAVEWSADRARDVIHFIQGLGETTLRGADVAAIHVPQVAHVAHMAVQALVSGPF